MYSLQIILGVKFTALAKGKKPEYTMIVSNKKPLHIVLNISNLI
jgi:hypothetical protein